MAITPVPDLPVLGSAPSTTDMANFDTRSDAFLPQLKPWGDVLKAIGDATKANAQSANTDAGIALAAQAGAQAAAARCSGRRRGRAAHGRRGSPRSARSACAR